MAHRLTHVENRADIRMVQSRSGACLTLETLPRGFRRKIQRKNFDGYLAMEPRISRLIDLAHAPFSDRRKDFVGPELVAFRERHLIEFS
jgi:hypothetical protein